MQTKLQKKKTVTGGVDSAETTTLGTLLSGPEIAETRADPGNADQPFQEHVCKRDRRCSSD